MKAPNFERAKLKRLLGTHGVKYDFVRQPKNKFGEPDPKAQAEPVATIVGVYHESASYVSTTSDNSTTHRTKKQPMILCAMDKKVSQLAVGDTVTIGNNVYKLSKVRDVENWGIYADISLEVVDNGGQ